MTIDEAKAKLDTAGDKNEEYHIIYDGIIESKLEELDPLWYAAVSDYYNSNSNARWYA